MCDSEPAKIIAAAATQASQALVSLQDFATTCRFCLQRGEDVELTSIFNGVQSKATRSSPAAVPDESDWGGMMMELTGLEVCVNGTSAC